MLDKILGKKNDDKKVAPLDLRKNEKKGPNIGDRLKDVVGKITKKKKEKKEEKPKKKIVPSEKKMPRPIPKPKAKPIEKARLRPTPKKPERLRRRIPEEDRRTLIGAAVFGLILILVVGSGYYFLVYQPYQETLQNAKAMKLNELESYFKGPLALDPRKQALLAEIEGASTPDEALAVDVLGPATEAWREYQTRQVKTKKDRYGRIMVVYAASSKKRVMMKVEDALKLVNEADASVLANMEIQTPDTVAVPIMISRLQAAGGLVTVGNMVDVYLKGGNETSPKIGGATVLAILRAKESGAIDAKSLQTRKMTVDELISVIEREQASSQDVEQLLRAAAAGGWNEAEVRALLEKYGWKLSDFERVSNLGELDAQYLLLLEIPREDVPFLIQNMDKIILTVPTQQAPTWMIRELQSIYG